TSLNTLGDGFVEAVSNTTLQNIANAQPGQSGGRIGGALTIVPVAEAPGQTRFGRFGWKNQQASLLSFSSDAYLNEQGVTNRFNLTENTSLGNSVAAFDTVPDNTPCTSSPSVICGEDKDDDIFAFAEFMRTSKAPSRDAALAATSDAITGSALFNQIGCNICHVTSITTAPAGTVINGGAFTVPAALGNKIIHPFGDFLLHNIGTGDGIVETNGEATRNMVRTAPLWGVRTHDRLMHDGGSSSAPSNSGAQSFTFNEAILRHAGQATSSRTAYQALTPLQKAQLIRFLKSL